MSKPMTVARYAREHRGWFYGCLLLFALVAFFCLKAIYDMTVYGAKAPLYAFIAGMVGFGATALGSLPGFYLHKLSDKAEDWMLGSSAGMMLAAAIFSLLLPSIETSEKLFTSELAATLWVLFGVFLGVVFLLIINALTPHEHGGQNYEGPEIEVKSGIWLFVLAIIIHNIPEGLAMGISFSAEDMQIGVPLTIAIALQDFPGRSGGRTRSLLDSHFTREGSGDRSVLGSDGTGRRTFRREPCRRVGLCLSAGAGVICRRHDVCRFPRSDS